jgi:hypothetical protein
MNPEGEMEAGRPASVYSEGALCTQTNRSGWDLAGGGVSATIRTSDLRVMSGFRSFPASA